MSLIQLQNLRSAQCGRYVSQHITHYALSQELPNSTAKIGYSLKKGDIA